MGSHRILVVEDDTKLRDLIARGLRANDFDVVTAVDGESALRSIVPPPDAVVLDIGLPDSDGRDVCQAMRSHGLDAPVIFLTARRDVHDRLSGFAAGGDDYVPKPFAFAELIARLRAVLRRHVTAQVAAGPGRLMLDPASHGATYEGVTVTLSPTEFRLLARLLADPDALVRRRELREAGWADGAIVSENTLDQYLSRLRRKVGELGAPYSIRASRGVGVRVVREVAGG
jgi:DNA-binding response OmpR family regulator